MYGSLSVKVNLGSTWVQKSRIRTEAWEPDLYGMAAGRRSGSRPRLRADREWIHICILPRER